MATTIFGWRMKKLLIWSRVPYFNHCPCRFCYHLSKKYHPNRCPLSTLFLRQNLICQPASRLYLKKLLSILQTVSSCSRYTTFLLSGSRFHQQNLPALTLPAICALTISDRGQGSLNLKCGRLGKHTSVCEPIFYDISQSVDCECPSLLPHVLLI